MTDLIKMENDDIKDMLDDLEEYYEAAGFADFYNRVLKNMSDEEIRRYHDSTFNEDIDFELEMWERKLRNEL